VIYRDNVDSLDLIEAFTALGISYRQDGGENVLKNRLISKLIRTLSFLKDPRNSRLLYEILNYDFFSLDLFDLIRINEFQNQNELSLLEIITDDRTLSTLALRNKGKVLETANKLKEWISALNNKEPLPLFLDIINYSGAIKQPEDAEGIKNINQLSLIYGELKSNLYNRKNYTLSDFIDDLQAYLDYDLRINDNSAQIVEENAVRIMTAHSAKGLEFEHLFLFRCEDKKWGNKTVRTRIRLPFGLINQQYADDLDEERRLFFVALTRAKKALTISYSQHSAKQRDIQPTIFLAEVPSELKVDVEIKQTLKLKAENSLVTMIVKPAPAHDDEIRDYLQNVLKDFQLTATKLNQYRKCPRCFLYNSILRIPQLKTPANCLGSAVHEALNDYLIRYKATKQLPLIDTVMADFEKALQKEHLPLREFENAREKGLGILANYLINNQSKFSPESISEVSFGRYRVEVEGVPINGKIDRIDFTAENVMRVVDYKTGNPDNASARLSRTKPGDYVIQVVFYKLLLENSSLFKGKVGEGIIEYLEPSRKDGQFKTFDIEFSADLIAETVRLMKETYSSIMALDFTKINTDKFNSCDNEYLHNIELKI
jgi:DNA helicase-2/ATP-dependent DNA helicase PcrA